METLVNVGSWLTDPVHLYGPTGVLTRLGEHLLYSALATVVAAVIALPLGLTLGHTGRGGNIAINIANVGRAIPTFGLIIMAFIVLRFSLLPVYIALIALAIPPILTNTYVGVRTSDAEAREAAAGMGMTGRQILWRVEAPIAVPLIMAGLRISAVQVVATATLAAFTGFGGLGRFIIDGLAKGVRGAARGLPEVIAGALLVAALAILTDLLLGVVQRRVTPRGLRGEPAAAQARGRADSVPADKAMQPS